MKMRDKLLGRDGSSSGLHQRSNHKQD